MPICVVLGGTAKHLEWPVRTTKSDDNVNAVGRKGPQEGHRRGLCHSNRPFFFWLRRLGRLHAVGHLEESLSKRAVQATKRQCETGETIRSVEELQEVVATTGVANHRGRSVIDKALNGGASKWQIPERAV